MKEKVTVNSNLNKRSMQIVMAAIPIVTLSLCSFVPFVWRALKTKRATDITLAFIFTGVEVAIFFLIDPLLGKDPNNVMGGLLVFLILAAAFAAAYVYRPLSKNEQVEEQQARPGSSFLQ